MLLRCCSPRIGCNLSRLSRSSGWCRRCSPWISRHHGIGRSRRRRRCQSEWIHSHLLLLLRGRNWCPKWIGHWIVLLLLLRRRGGHSIRLSHLLLLGRTKSVRIGLIVARNKSPRRYAHSSPERCHLILLHWWRKPSTSHDTSATAHTTVHGRRRHHAASHGLRGHHHLLRRLQSVHSSPRDLPHRRGWRLLLPSHSAVHRSPHLSPALHHSIHRRLLRRRLHSRATARRLGHEAELLLLGWHLLGEAGDGAGVR